MPPDVANPALFSPPLALPPKITLSFDNGPEPDVTPLVLETLARHSLKASFFVMGRKVATAEGRAFAMRASAEGHWIGNHTYSHTRPLGELDRDTALREFEQTEEALAWLDQKPRLFRALRARRQARTAFISSRSGREVGGRKLHDRPLELCSRRLARPGRLGDDRLTAMPVERLEPAWYSIDHQPSGAMKHLDRFLTALRESNATIVQEYPDDCIPIREGRIVGPIQAWTPAN